MAASLTRSGELTRPPTSLARETFAFIFHKIKAFAPELIVSCCVGLIFFSFAHHGNPQLLITAVLQTFTSNIMMLKMTGLTTQGINGPTWYLSSMLIGCLLLYPMLRRHGINPVLGVIGLLALGGLFVWEGNKYGFAYVYQWVGITYKGNIRAVAELAVGATLLYPIVTCLRDVNVSRLGAYGLSGAKYICLSVIMWYILTNRCPYAGYVFIAICVALVISLSGLSADGRWYQNRVSLYCGRLSLPLYLSHYFYATELGCILPGSLPPPMKTTIYIACSVLTTLLVFCVASWFRRKTSY